MAWRGLGPTGYHTLHAVEWGGRRQRRVVVCAHGYSGNGRDFDFLARRLAHGARVVCPDIAGRGRSAWLPNPLAYHFGQFLADLRALIAELGADEVEWVGTSMGGLLGMLLAGAPRSPVRRLVLNDVGAFVPTRALAAIGRHLRAPERFASLADIEAHLRRTHRSWGAMRDEHWSHLVRHRARRVPGGYVLHYDPQIARVLPSVPFASGLFFWSAWYRVRCPVLVVRGERSGILPADVLHTMREAKPHTEIVEIADAGHAPSLMQEAQIEVVADFLGRGERRVLKHAA